MDKDGKIEQKTYDLLNELKKTFHNHKDAEIECSIGTYNLLEKFVETVDHLYSELGDYQIALQKSHCKNFEDFFSLASHAETKLVEANQRYEKRNANAGIALQEKFEYTLLLAKAECELFFTKYPSVLANKKLRRGDLSVIRKNMESNFCFDTYQKQTGMPELPSEKALYNNIKKALKIHWTDFYNENYPNK